MLQAEYLCRCSKLSIEGSYLYHLLLVLSGPGCLCLLTAHCSLSLRVSESRLTAAIFVLTTDGRVSVSNLLLCKLLHSGQSLTASRPSLLWLQCCRPLCTVLCTAVHCTVHLYTPVQRPNADRANTEQKLTQQDLISYPHKDTTHQT